MRVNENFDHFVKFYFLSNTIVLSNSVAVFGKPYRFWQICCSLWNPIVLLLLNTTIFCHILTFFVKSYRFYQTNCFSQTLSYFCQTLSFLLNLLVIIKHYHYFVKFYVFFWNNTVFRQSRPFVLSNTTWDPTAYINNEYKLSS